MAGKLSLADQVRMCVKWKSPQARFDVIVALLEANAASEQLFVSEDRRSLYRPMHQGSSNLRLAAGERAAVSEADKADQRRHLRLARDNFFFMDQDAQVTVLAKAAFRPALEVLMANLNLAVILFLLGDADAPFLVRETDACARAVGAAARLAKLNPPILRRQYTPPESPFVVGTRAEALSHVNGADTGVFLFGLTDRGVTGAAYQVAARVSHHNLIKELGSTAYSLQPLITSPH